MHIVTRTEDDQLVSEEASSTPSKAKAAKQTDTEPETETETAEDSEQQDNGVEPLDRTPYGKFIMHYGQ